MIVTKVRTNEAKVIYRILSCFNEIRKMKKGRLPKKPTYPHYPTNYSMVTDWVTTLSFTKWNVFPPYSADSIL